MKIGGFPKNGFKAGAVTEWQQTGTQTCAGNIEKKQVLASDQERKGSFRDYNRGRDQLWQARGAHEIAVTLLGGTAAFIDGPNYETLSAPAISCREHTRHAGGKLTEFRFGVRARITFNPKL
jgi:hypothetical protein